MLTFLLVISTFTAKAQDVHLHSFSSTIQTYDSYGNPSKLNWNKDSTDIILSDN